MTDLDIHLPGILLAYSILVVGICSPGPAVLAIIGTSLERGRQSGVSLALGVVCGSAFWGCAAALGMATLLTSTAYALVALKIVGGLYLLWLAFKSVRSAMAHTAAKDPALLAKAGRPSQMFRNGFLIHLTNPKAVMAWLATIALGVSESSPVWVSLVIVAGGIVISLVGNFAYALLFSTRSMASVYAAAKRPIEFVFATLFGVAGLKLLSSRI